MRNERADSQATQISQELIAYLATLQEPETGEWLAGNYRLIAHHEGEMMDAAADRLPVATKLDVVQNHHEASQAVMATFPMCRLTKESLEAYLAALH